jgi:hypothetical protein
MTVEATFVNVLREMFSRDEYLIPYVWAQRLLRRDNYQMASQALLEDMFYDTLGDFLNRNAPQHSLVRRSGAEPWDYKFDQTGFSHKEGMKKLIVSKWQAGEGPKNKIPRWPTWTFTEPVTFVYTNPRCSLDLELHLQSKSGYESTLKSAMKPLSLESTRDKAFQKTHAYLVVMHRERSRTSIEISHVLPVGSWRTMDYRKLRGLIGDDPLSADFLWFNLTQRQARTGIDLLGQEFPIRGEITSEELPSGVYVLEQSSLVQLPQESNNKAHFVVGSTMDALMKQARSRDFFVPLPLWPALYTDMTPPNLYHDLRSRYDALFQARANEPRAQMDLIWLNQT